MAVYSYIRHKHPTNFITAYYYLNVGGGGGMKKTKQKTMFKES